ncbi:hypothetical protein MSAN_01511100 [Mycena sanguinolenta]|uniref:Protein kinase domain-containing protein n=1 Tax=Mycena sanguinolenta TaxID=230812 RepID=A0A8H7CZL0_9AGAR|nr:hypothetical protein MSAN_01511100 [Mycena sanguinolenta]
MDPHPDSDLEVIVLSTSDAKSTPYPGVVSPEASRRARKAKPFIKSFGFSPSLRRESFKTSGIRKTRTRKYWEKKLGRQATQHTVNKYYSYHITGGFGGSGGEGHNQGGDGGIGQGPTVYFSQPEAREPSAFRTIRLGDLNVVKEFKEMRSSPRWSVVGCQTPRATVRRVYKAKLEGHESGQMTVAMYEGDGAEEEWNQDLANYESIRHPNIMQLYGLVSTKNLYAMIFHNGTDPDFLVLIWSDAPIIKTTEFWEAISYILNVFPKFMREYGNFPVWIRPSTGELCLDLAQRGSETKPPFCPKSWLAQANRIFTELEEVAHIEDYVCVNDIWFNLRIPYKRDIPEGYLFVCPPKNFHTDTEHHMNLYQWPACPAYWSLDPSGANRLSTEDARILGFPAIHMETVVQGWSWDHSIYKGLQRFHEGKGHDPESWEVARQLGYPLFEMLGDRIPFLARKVESFWGHCERDDLGFLSIVRPLLVVTC